MKRRGLITLLVVCTICVLFIPVAPYLWFFKGGVVSSNTSDWGAFGSYISGVIGPILSFVSIISVFLLSRQQIEQTKKKSEDDIKQLRLSNDIENELKVFNDAYNTVFSILFRTMPSEIMMKDLLFQGALQEQIGTQESPKFESTEDLNRLYFQISDKEMIIQRIEKVFELVSTYVNFISEGSAKEQLKTSKNGFMAQLRNDLNSTSENIKIMLLSADRLNRFGYSSLLLKYRFTTICELSMLLSRLGLIEPQVLSMLSIYWSQPDHTSNTIRLPNTLKDNLFNRSIDEFGLEQMGSIDSWTLHFEQYKEPSRGNLVTSYKLSRNQEAISFDLLNGFRRKSG